MLRLRLAGALVLLLTLGPGVAAGAPVPTREQVVRRVAEAVRYYRTNGREKALAELNRRDSEFAQGLDYVDVHDLNGVCLAQPRAPDAIGVNRMNARDAQGRPILREIMEQARTRDEGWIEYTFQNPNTGVIEKRIAYWIIHDGMIFKARTDKR